VDLTVCFVRADQRRTNLAMLVVKKPTDNIGKAAISFGEISGN